MESTGASSVGLSTTGRNATWPSSTITAGKADSTGCRSTIDHILFEQLVEYFCWCSPAACFAWSRVQGMGNRIPFVCVMLIELRFCAEALSAQTIGVLVAAAPPVALQAAEADVKREPG